ncbi:hypothetical protein PACTADRAFT_2170 [Pachysolen tannophilus NRRL Y-2460]|uniref:Macro domain-containing protein n=1 Tax=Pachysolen tannophilus NRRL Y-2460 TaxID=669874 RepID=A0A1E4TVQ2_PACTA|nr:hypothetical protein PACTADRAFT_2170 [Pachysolen tannophilus NRRL Y-2460]
MRILLVDVNEAMHNAWKTALLEANAVPERLSWLNKEVEVIACKGRLELLSEKFEFHHRQIGCTAIVSPGNSLGYLGGGFDLAIAKLFSSDETKWKETEKKFRENLYKSHHGYSVSPSLVPLYNPESNAWKNFKSKTVLHVPTMKVPGKLITDTVNKEKVRKVMEFIFDCTWQMLAEVDQHNRSVNLDQGSDIIDTIIVPALGAGYGGIPYQYVARSMVGAIAIFTSNNLSAEQKSVLCLKFSQQDFTKLVTNWNSLDLGEKKDYDPATDPLQKLLFP